MMLHVDRDNVVKLTKGIFKTNYEIKKKDFFNVKRRDLKLCSCDWLISSLVGVSEKKQDFSLLEWECFMEILLNGSASVRRIIQMNVLRNMIR